MPKETAEKGVIPFIVLAIGVPILLIVCFFIIFSTGGISFGGGSKSNQPQTQTPKPEPSKTPKQKVQAEFLKVALTMDLERTRTVYCYYENADNVQKESNQLKIELQKSAECLSSYEQYKDDRSEKLTSCTSGCNTTNKNELNICDKDRNAADVGDYDHDNCVVAAEENLKSCHNYCNETYKTAIVADYNTSCQSPVVDHTFRLDELVKQYCQEKPE